MTPLLILAGNHQQYHKWYKASGKAAEGMGFNPVYVPSNTIKYLGYSNCHYMRVGTFYEAGYEVDMFKYFDYKNITEIHASLK